MLKNTMIFHEKHHHGDMPAFEVFNATKQMHQIISSIIHANFIDDPDYIAKSKSRPFFQGGYDFDRSGGWIFIEMWTKDVEAAREFYDYVKSKLEGIEYHEDN